VTPSERNFATRDFAKAPCTRTEAFEWSFMNLCDDATQVRWYHAVMRPIWVRQDRQEERESRLMTGDATSPPAELG
jgi:hypothetical protein